MKYQSKNRKYLVKLSDSSLELMLKCINEAGDVETGGVIVGTYSDDHSSALVKSLTGPPVDSRSGRTWFQRGIQGLKKLFEGLWKENVYYLGEWHFHPYAPPSPSISDILQMFEIARSERYRCPEPILIIIGGSVQQYEIRCFVFVRKKQIELYSTRNEE